MSDSDVTKAQFVLPPSGGHATLDMYMHRETRFDVVYRDALGDGNKQIFLHLGALTLAVNAEQWRVISDAVESVLTETVPA